MRTNNMSHLSAATKSAWSLLLNKRMSEGLFILVLTLGCFVLLSLVSYQAPDPVWLKKSSLLNAVLRSGNAGGPIGACIA
jgi:S-DNA-T family DNA segregation ATPase FtsK/SpoIIIE